ncbi:MAG: decarboxylating 6-phosphogluconate dehydrogenase [Deltaproteobacteria bacterium]|nr:decarboxylating 6-phosphogluconate dehydrogenase [Deltaproteobacteria bacterium]
MEIAILGLGKMGSNMARRLARGGHDVVVFNRTVEKAHSLAEDEKHMSSVSTLGELVDHLAPPRVCWVMVPAGIATDEMIDALLEILTSGDTIIDGGNSFYQDSVRRSARISEKGLHFIDVGTGGGIWGLTKGYSMMIGGEKPEIDRLQSIFETLAPAPDKGWGYVGPAGAGHFVKMVHNGIEYGLMQAYAEGFEIMKTKRDFDLDLKKICEIWRYGSVVRSWLLDLISAALSEDQDLRTVRGWVADSGEGRWTVAEAINQDVAAPIITLSLLMRFISRQDESYAAKLLAAMRHQFGGHGVVDSDKEKE